jgi:hypothetical protein
MRIRLNPRGRFDVYKVSKKFVLTREWQECKEGQAEPLLGSSYKGLPLVEIEDVEVGEAEIEILPEDEFDTGEQEGESYAEN